jgi:hypothetical protein
MSYKDDKRFAKHLVEETNDINSSLLRDHAGPFRDSKVVFIVVEKCVQNPRCQQLHFRGSANLAHKMKDFPSHRKSNITIQISKYINPETLLYAKYCCPLMFKKTRQVLENCLQNWLQPYN